MTSHYDTLGVPRDASPAEIRKAYRSAALRWHPDKNHGAREEAERRFVQVAAAYEVLSDTQKRAAYDRGGSAVISNFHGGGEPFDFQRASQMFQENFGEALAQSWRPGKFVTGTLVRDGKRISITINPDGTTDEKEEEGAAGKSEYSFVQQSEGGSTTIQFSGSIGQALADYVLPQSMQRVPIVGPALSSGLSWAPTLACLGCCYWCCCKGTPMPVKRV
eukprot:CAMPEP_0119339318 /NCGR_PEP_ID=MMETSP1333-20130426/98018_1 /TAXON_ID=418940 /ORGANISM="Scyphosphaera apsteinii, Strain RCC1455" /LENGTH=218 /DNA_ID=CAMNT_0007350815 /DNA_START=20 /DNA_END=676 /DNA_ORIENTATION=+